MVAVRLAATLKGAAHTLRSAALPLVAKRSHDLRGAGKAAQFLGRPLRETRVHPRAAVRAEIRAAVAEIRRRVCDLRSPALDQVAAAPV